MSDLSHLADVAAARTAAFVAERRAELAAREQASGRSAEAVLADLESALSAELAKRPAMVAQQCQQQQANAGAPVSVDVVQSGRLFVRSMVRATDGKAECLIPYDFGLSRSANLDAGRRAFATGRNHPVMVPQQAQQQQACAGSFYAFEARGERADPVQAPRMPQDAEGITPRTIQAQTVQVRTRAEWYAFARACRTLARERMLKRQAGETFIPANICGRMHKLTVARYSQGAEWDARAGRYRQRTFGTPVALIASMISARPRRALIAVELAWAAQYRGNAARDGRNRDAHRRALSVKGARHSVAEARELYSALDCLPG